MTPDELRDKIARDQGWTQCRCGHYLECCADCRGWLVEHSPRIVAGWRWFVTNRVGTPLRWGDLGSADAAEADDLAYFEGVR